MNSPSTSLGEADFNRQARSSGFVRQPWLTPYAIRTGAGIGFSNFEHIPVVNSAISTHEKFMKQSPPRQQPMPGIEELKQKWPQYVGAARTAWGEITESELLNLDNHTQQLAELIHARYAVTREEADMQVQRFFAKHRF